MKKGHVRWLFGPVFGALLLLGAALAFSATPSARAEAPAAGTYTDAAGDATGGAPDVTSVAVSSVDGVVTLAITAVGQWPVDATSAEIGAALNTDEDTATGSSLTGSERLILVDLTPEDAAYGLYTWADGDWQLVGDSSLKLEVTEDTWMFTVPASELGVTSGFAFYVKTSVWTGDRLLGNDVAPDASVWHYTLTTAEPATPSEAQPPAGAGALAGLRVDGSVYVSGDDLLWHRIDPVTFAALGYDANTIGWFYGSLPGTIGDPIPAVAPAPAVTAPIVPLAESVNVVPVIGAPTPAKLTPGKSVVITFPVVNGVTGEKLTSVKMMSAAPTLAGKLIRPHVERFTNGLASVGLKVPTTTKAKQLQVKLTIGAGTTTVTRVVTIPIT